MRATQFIDYLNSRYAPSKEKDNIEFTHLSITDKLKKFRRKKRNEWKKSEEII
tara:strand:+ start:1335 stop:1493 length:159 start_codon:yes stop_codon:yes gene_type:complete